MSGQKENAFFSADDVRAELKSFVWELDNSKIADEIVAPVKIHLRKIAVSMQQNPAAWDKCRYSIKSIGDSFLTWLRKIKTDSSGPVFFDVFSIFYQYLSEHFLIFGITQDLEAVHAYALNNQKRFSTEAWTQIQFALYRMPALENARGSPIRLSVN